MHHFRFTPLCLPSQSSRYTNMSQSMSKSRIQAQNSHGFILIFQKEVILKSGDPVLDCLCIPETHKLSYAPLGFCGLSELRGSRVPLLTPSVIRPSDHPHSMNFQRMEMAQFQVVFKNSLGDPKLKDEELRFLDEVINYHVACSQESRI